MKKLSLNQMEKVNGGKTCWELLMKAGDNITNGSKFDRLIRKYKRQCQ